MNRRELLLGLSAALVAAKIPAPVELAVYDSSPAIDVKALIAHLERIHADLITKICNPPYILYADGSMAQMSLEADQKALECINIALKDLYASEA